MLSSTLLLKLRNMLVKFFEMSALGSKLLLKLLETAQRRQEWKADKADKVGQTSPFPFS